MDWTTWIQQQNARPLSRQRVEFEKCSVDPGYFIDTYCWARDERTGEVWRFRLWRFQLWLLRILERSELLAILKGRQLGITWLAVAFAVWLVTFRADLYVLLFSQREDEAKELLKRCQFIRSHLPGWLQAGLRRDSTLEMETERGGRIRVFPTRGSEARTYAAALAIVDEAGTVANLSALVTALLPVVEGGGRLVVLGTGRGMGDFFSLIRKVRAGLMAGWRFVFLPWHSRPDRGPDWREEQRPKYTQAWQLYQEHPETVDEAFQLGHRPRFDTERIKELLGRTRRPLPVQAQHVPESLAHLVRGGQLRVWRRPKPSRAYLIAADTSEGIPGLDRCAAVVMDAVAGLPVAELVGYWPDHEYARLLAALGGWYRWATLAVERNNTGHSVINSLHNAEGYAYLYRMRTHERGGRPRFGWQTTTGTKPRMYDAMDKALQDHTRRWYSEDLLMEALTCERRDDGTVGAPQVEGAFDDLLTAYCIAEAVRQEQRY